MKSRVLCSNFSQESRHLPLFRFLQPQHLTLQAGQQMVEIASLNPMQLQQLQEQLKSELELFSNSMQQLRIATSKFQESLQSVAKLDGTEDGES